MPGVVKPLDDEVSFVSVMDGEVTGTSVPPEEPILRGDDSHGG